jgi:hypothetical protein
VQYFLLGQEHADVPSRLPIELDPERKSIGRPERGITRLLEQNRGVAGRRSQNVS